MFLDIKQKGIQGKNSQHTQIIGHYSSEHTKALHTMFNSGVTLEEFQLLFYFETHLNNTDNIFCETSYFLVNKNLLGLLERVQHNVIIIYVILSR